MASKNKHQETPETNSKKDFEIIQIIKWTNVQAKISKFFSMVAILQIKRWLIIQK